MRGSFAEGGPARSLRAGLLLQAVLGGPGRSLCAGLVLKAKGGPGRSMRAALLLKKAVLGGLGRSLRTGLLPIAVQGARCARLFCPLRSWALTVRGSIHC